MFYAIGRNRARAARGIALSYFLSITRLRVRSWRFMPSFAFRTLRSVEQVKRAAGFLEGSLLPDRKLTFWTMTLWDAQASMRAFITGGDHLAVMPRLLDWCDEASVAHWEQPDRTLAPWNEADGRMRAQGRPSKVRHPSADHAALTFAAPRTGGAAPIKPAAPGRAASA